MTSYPNWNVNSSKTTYKHKSNPDVVVLIRPNMSFPNWRAKYLIYHSHPASNNTAVMQQPEGAMSMESARRGRKNISGTGVIVHDGLWIEILENLVSVARNDNNN